MSTVRKLKRAVDGMILEDLPEIRTMCVDTQELGLLVSIYPPQTPIIKIISDKEAREALREMKR